jgi:predicted dehydrogenase
MSHHNTNRRQFLKTSAAITAAGVPYFAWGSPLIGQDAKTESKNDRPILGCIGTGDRWNSVGPAAMNFADCVAVCDVDANHAEKGKTRAMESNSRKGRERTVDVYEDYRKVLDRKDIEIVTIVTPDHWHSKIAIEAMKSGKDVYCEKPLTLTIDEGKQIIKVLKETGRVFQVGTQQRSEFKANRQEIDTQFLVAIALCHAGRLGEIKRVRCEINRAPTSDEIPEAPVPTHLNWDMWLGQAPKTAYLEGKQSTQPRYPQSRTHYEFRWWYEYSGGKMTDWGAHHVDIAQWAIRMDNSGPISVEGTAEHPVPFEKGMPTISNRYNVAHKFDVVCQFPNNVELNIGSEGENGITIEGSKGAIFVSRGALRDVEGTVIAGLKDQPLPEDAITKLCKGKKPGNHMANFFECCKDRSLPISDVYTHHRAMTTCHLANIAIRLGRKLKWDAEKEQIVGDAEVNTMLKREQRKGFEIVT